MLPEPGCLNLTHRPRYLLAEVAPNCVLDVVAKLLWPPLRPGSRFCAGLATARCPCRHPAMFLHGIIGKPGRAQPGSVRTPPPHARPPLLRRRTPHVLAAPLPWVWSQPRQGRVTSAIARNCPQQGLTDLSCQGSRSSSLSTAWGQPSHTVSR